jgi:D-tagatose-1,6-bisphosphate aldolase subunit GatZ/KbaZ
MSAREPSGLHRVADSLAGAAPLLDVLRRHRSGEAVGITSVCSAHPLVIEAAVAQAVENGTALLVEATSNQVDQFGGYTGMRPTDFRDLVMETADKGGLPRSRIVLGGDHLGPNVWRSRDAEAAMAEAEHLVRAYVEAGFAKIHLDCSMACAGDDEPLTDGVVAGRAARLARAAEEAARALSRRSDIVYVVGTEVPVPGGAHETIDELTPTPADEARATLLAHRDAFAAAGVGAAFDRVVALVVQPGVEFNADRVVDYVRDRTTELRRVVDDPMAPPLLVLEAHSTDYQTVDGLTRLVEDHWAVLKVGPGLTFALREGLFALAAIEDLLVPAARRSHLVDVVDRAMLARPRWWEGYYEGDHHAKALARRYSYSDRMRYYWPEPSVVAAYETLLANLRTTGIPLHVLSAFLPAQYVRVRSGELAADPAALAVDRVRDVLRGYAAACMPRAAEQAPSPWPSRNDGRRHQTNEHDRSTT